MPWFRVDDSFHSHAKALTAGNAALGLWVRCGSYCAQHLTDGFVPRRVVLLYGTAQLAAKLVEAGLWRAVEGGWSMHDYGDYNPTAERIRAERRAAAQRQRHAREATKSQRESRRDNSVSHGPPDPYPTQPNPPSVRLGKVTPDRARKEDPACDRVPAIAPAREEPPPSLPDRPPCPAVTGPTAADAYRLVDAAIGREHPHTVRTALAVDVGALLVDGTDPDLVSAALRLWLHKPHLGPRSLPSLVSEVIRLRNRPASHARPSTTDQRVAAIQALKDPFTESEPLPMLRAITGGAS